MSATRRAGQALPTLGFELGALYCALARRLARRASWKYRLSGDDAVEVVQEVFLLAVVKLDGRGDPRAWLYRTLDNMAANWRRKQIRRRDLMARWGETELDLDSRRLDENGQRDDSSAGNEAE